MAPSYYNQRGLTKRDITRIENWITAMNVFTAIAGLFTIPIISALIAQAAAVFTERQANTGKLQMRHLVALADRGWTNPFKFRNTSRTHESKRGEALPFRWFVSFAAFVVLLGNDIKTTVA